MMDYYGDMGDVLVGKQYQNSAYGLREAQEISNRKQQVLYDQINELKRDKNNYENEMATYFETQGTTYEEMFEEYRNVLRAVAQTGIKEGGTHDALVCFLDTADVLQDEMENLSQCAKIKLNDYITLIDECDKYVY